MEEFPEELRTPPVTLISMVGCPERHTLISTHFLSEQPPINTLALPDLSKIYLFSKKDSDSTATSSPPGILKRDWLIKHRTKLPSVLAALFPAHDVFGDPAQWLQVCTDLDSIKYDFCVLIFCFGFHFVWCIFILTIWKLLTHWPCYGVSYDYEWGVVSWLNMARYLSWFLFLGRIAIRGRNIKLAVLVIHSTGQG